MGRSCINIAGNPAQGQNLGGGTGIYAGKLGSHTLSFKSLQGLGGVTITNDSGNIYFSGGSEYVVNNGLTSANNVISLGGTLTGNTTIDLSGSNLSLGSNLIISSTYTKIAHVDTNETNLNLNSSGITVTDNIKNLGLVYDANYWECGALTPRWIPDSLWVCNEIEINKAMYGNGVIERDDIVGFGSDMYWDTDIELNSHTLRFLDEAQPINIGTGFNASVFTTEIQPDGKIIVGGFGFSQFSGITANNIIRLNRDGSKDTTFNYGTGFNGYVYDIALQSDGKILVGGAFTTYCNGTTINRIARLESDGTLDTTFNVGSGVENVVERFAVQDDCVLVVGRFTTYSGITVNRIVRLCCDGSIDESFNTGTGFNNSVRDIEVQKDGKVLAAGAFTTYCDGTVACRLTRLNNDGSIDTTFNAGTGPDNQCVYDMVLQPDGKIIISGAFDSYRGNGMAGIARINSDGTTDATFNTGGAGFTSNWVESVALLSDGKIMVGGNFGSYNGVTSLGLIKLNYDGSIDTTFNNGFASTPFIYELNKIDGNRILVSGSFLSKPYSGTTYPNMFKINSDGYVANNILGSEVYISRLCAGSIDVFGNTINESCGAVYVCDYSPTMGTNPRWIPDAAWVTGQTGGGGGGITWNGSTANGIATYIDSSTICSQPNIQFSGTTLSLTNAGVNYINASSSSGSLYFNTSGRTGTTNYALALNSDNCALFKNKVIINVDDNSSYQFCIGNTTTYFGHANVSTRAKNTTWYAGTSGTDGTYRISTSGTYSVACSQQLVLTTGCKLKIHCLQMYTGAAAGCVLTSDVDGNATWQTPTGGGGGITWTGSTANGIATYVDSSTVCSEPNLTFDGTNLVVGGKTCTSTLLVSTGAATGCVLTSDASGNATWQTPTGGGTSYTANNGITLSSTTFKLGGALNQNTIICPTCYTLDICGISDFGDYCVRQLFDVENGRIIHDVYDTGFVGGSQNILNRYLHCPTETIHLVCDTTFGIMNNCYSNYGLCISFDGLQVANTGGCLEINFNGTYLNTRNESLYLCGVGSNTTSNVLYYNSSTGLVTYGASSDCRLKCNFIPIDVSNETMLEDICGYSFEYSNLSNQEGDCSYGLIAQDVEKYFPLAVSDSIFINDETYKSLSYEKMIPVMWNIIKEQEKRIKSLESKLE